MPKIDFKKELKELYLPSAKKISLVDVPPMQFFMVDGKGYPGNSQEYQDALNALYGLSFTLKFMLKQRGGFDDWTVMPLEGLWWVDGSDEFDLNRKDDWRWTSMIRQPDFITEDLVQEAREELRRKKDPPALDRLRLERFHEGLSIQILHVGPYSEEEATIRRLHGFMEENGFGINGKHHEIYLSDPRRTAPERLKTVIRLPVRK